MAAKQRLGIASAQLVAIVAAILVLGGGVLIVRSQSNKMDTNTVTATTSPSPTPTSAQANQTPSTSTTKTIPPTSYGSPTPTSVTTIRSGICGTVMYAPDTLQAKQGETTHGIAKEMIALDSNHKIVARVTSNSNGSFVMHLPAGQYTLETAEDGDYGRKMPVTVHGETCATVTYTIAPPHDPISLY